MNNPINLAIGVAVLCCSFSCATSFTNTGLGDIFGGAGGLVTGAGGLVTGAGNAAGDAALTAADAVTGGTNLTQVSADEECKITCGGANAKGVCTGFGGEHDTAALAAGLSQAQLDEHKAWCIGEGSGSDTKFGKPCCLPELTDEEKMAAATAQRAERQAEGIASPGEEWKPTTKVLHSNPEGYMIRKRVI